MSDTVKITGPHATIHTPPLRQNLTSHPIPIQPMWITGAMTFKKPLSFSLCIKIRAVLVLFIR